MEPQCKGNKRGGGAYVYIMMDPYHMATMNAMPMFGNDVCALQGTLTHHSNDYYP